MNIFIIGFGNSGRTTIAKALASHLDYKYVDSAINIFRTKLPNEDKESYEELIDSCMTNLLNLNPNIVVDQLKNTKNSIIDNIQSPYDMINLFNSKEDYIIFCNRTDNEVAFFDKAKIGTSLIKDYCYWLSAMNLLDKERWLEINYKLPGEQSDFVKKLQNRNSVYIVKNINKAISLLKELI